MGTGCPGIDFAGTAVETYLVEKHTVTIEVTAAGKIEYE
jgi:hypothetical protein